MRETPPRTGIEPLRWAYAGVVTGVLLLLVAAAAIGRVADAIPDWLGAAAVLVAAVPGLFVIRYYRRRPLEEEGIRDYALTVLFRIGVSLLPALVGFAMFLATSAWWLQLLGSFTSLLGLSWSIPSAADYLRHRALAVDIAEHPPEEVWGSAPEGEKGAWESEPGHGHGLFE